MTAPTTTALCPLPLSPLFYEKVWGGRALERLGKALPPAKPIGESWELADMPTTSASGAGGGAARTPVASGPFAGRSLCELVQQDARAMLGPSKLAEGGAFPLLVKFLDARENLSVQVHPSPAYAHANPSCKLKTECWYILDAQPGAVIYKGIKPGTTPDAFARAIERGTVAELMIAVPAVPGECHNLPSGTCHALGAGVLVAEVQTPSDTTFRVFDWGRTGRELHVQQALACIDFGPAPAGARLATGADHARLVTTEFFTLDQLRPRAGSALPIGAEGDRDGRAYAITLLDGAGTLRDTAGAFADVPILRGQTVLVPAQISARTRLVAGPGGADLLRACIL